MGKQVSHKEATKIIQQTRQEDWLMAQEIGRDMHPFILDLLIDVAGHCSLVTEEWNDVSQIKSCGIRAKKILDDIKEVDNG